MAKSWRKRLRRGRLASWLGRIEGVEKPALLVGIGLVLYRVWRNKESRVDFKMGTLGGNLKTRWRGALDRVRRRFGGRSDAADATTNGAAAPPSPPS